MKGQFDNVGWSRFQETTPDCKEDGLQNIHNRMLLRLLYRRPDFHGRLRDPGGDMNVRPAKTMDFETKLQLALRLLTALRHSEEATTEHQPMLEAVMVEAERMIDIARGSANDR